jgi:L-asparaginase II
MTDPVLVEVTRGGLLESCHRAAVAVVDADDASVLTMGDVARPVFPRSAVKALQALPLVELGGADQYGLGEPELALAAGSHAGERDHIVVVERMLAGCGLDARALACGAHWPLDPASAQALVRAGLGPSAIHNNCSGKHAGFLCLARGLRLDHLGYVNPNHPVQREVRAALESLTASSLDEPVTAIDGCSVPTWAIPLRNLAYGFARFGTGRGLEPKRAHAAVRIRTACAANPFFVAGTGRFPTKMMEHFRERVFVKPGAEGVLCAALPQQGLGIALKCDDGAARGAEVIMAALISRLLPFNVADRAVLDRFIWPVVRNWNDLEVGVLRPSPLLFEISLPNRF